jgi:SAM-dependent methyltransferase
MKFEINIINKFYKQTIKFFIYLSKKYDKSSPWLKMLILLALLFLLLHRYNEYNPKIEGFAKLKKFELKENKDLYDEFYVKYYDKIMNDSYKTKYEFNEICHTSKPNKKSEILDIGCGTGDLVKKFVKNGYKIKGVDKSKAMIDKAKSKYPECEFLQKDALNSMNHPPKSFTNILCTYFTIYYIKNKKQFFKNAFTWLKPNGTLTLHLVNRDKFNPIVNAADILLNVSPQKYAKNRITSSFVKFNNFKYKADFKLQKHKNQAIFDETFKDDKTGQVRQNKHTFYMDGQKNILTLAKQAGFILEGKINMNGCNYEHQYLYVLKKP